MKRFLFLSLVMSCIYTLNAQYFSQDFSSSTTVADYISTTPNAGQFYAISADNASLAKTIDNGALKISRTGNVAFSAYRNYSFTTNPTFVQLKLDFKATSLGTIPNNPLLMFLIGNTFTSSSNGVTSNFATRFGLKPGTVTGNLRAYIIDAVGGSAPSSADFDPSVYQTFTLVVNNSGASQTYIAPDATEESLATGKLDFWIGTTRAFNDFGLYNTDAVKGKIDGFKFQTGSTTSGLGDFYFDNFEFKTLPLRVNSSSNITTLVDCPACDVLVNNGTELTIDANRTYNSLTIAPGGKITLNNANTLTTTGGITLQNTGSATASFVDSRTDDNPSAIVGTVSQAVTATNRNWYVAVPVSGQSAANITLSGAKVVKRNEGNSSWDDVTGSLTAGVGYIAVASTSTGTTSWSLNGNLNSGKVLVGVTRSGASSAGFNLLANPYPSYLNWEQVLSLSAGNESLLEPSIWYRTASYNSGLSKYDYTFNTYNSVGRVATPTGTTGYIPPMQAFWVRANSAGTLTFTNAMRSHGDGASNLLKAPKVNNQKIIRLQVANNDNVGDETVLYFDENAQNSFDKYDTPKMFNNIDSKPEIYTNVGGEDLVINGMNTISENPQLNLGFRTGQTNIFTVKATEISNLDANTRVILKDSQLNSEVDITVGAAYSFTSDAVNTVSRFSLIFRSPSITTGLNSPALSMFITKNANNQLTVTTNSNEKARIIIYSTFGQVVKTLATSSYSTLIGNNFGAGVYIVTLEIGDVRKTQKIILM